MDSASPNPAAGGIVAVINSFNRLPLLREALGALTAAFRADPSLGGTVVVFEAGSSDGSREFLDAWAREHPADRLEIVQPSSGQGNTFSDGINAGCAAALERFPASKFLLLYETDNWIAGPDPLRRARELLTAESSLAAVGWTVRRHAGEFIGYGMRYPSILGLAAGPDLVLRLQLEAVNDTPWQTTTTALGGIEWRRCDIVFTSPLLIRRETWERAGGFDAAAFPFSDCDLDWAWRCERRGLGVQAVVRSDAVVHDNRAQLSAWSGDRVLKLHRARMTLLKRHVGAARANAIKPLLWLRHALECALLTARPGAGKKLAIRKEMLRTAWRDYRVRESLPSGL